MRAIPLRFTMRLATAGSSATSHGLTTLQARCISVWLCRKLAIRFPAVGIFTPGKLRQAARFRITQNSVFGPMGFLCPRISLQRPAVGSFRTYKSGRSTGPRWKAAQQLTPLVLIFLRKFRALRFLVCCQAMSATMELNHFREHRTISPLFGAPQELAFGSFTQIMQCRRIRA